MPYKVVKRGTKYVTVNKETGEEKGTHTSQVKAEAQMRLLHGIDKGTIRKR